MMMAETTQVYLYVVVQDNEANQQLLPYLALFKISEEVFKQESMSQEIRDILQIIRKYVNNIQKNFATCLDDDHLLKSILDHVSQVSESTLLTFCYLTNLSLSILQCLQLPSITELCYFNTLNQTVLNEKTYKYNNSGSTLLDEITHVESYEFYKTEKFSITCTCMEECYDHGDVQYISAMRSQGSKQAKNELSKNLQGSIGSFTEDNVGGSSGYSTVPPQSSTTNKHLTPALEAAIPDQRATLHNESLTGQNQAGGLTEATGYTTSTLPGATVSVSQHYGTDFDEDQPISREERRKDVTVVSKEKDVDSILKSHRKDEASRKKLSSELQATAKPSAKPRTSANVDKPPRFPRKACVVYKNEQYSLDPKLLSLPRATKYLVKVRTEINPGRFMAKLELHCASEDEKLPNLDVTATTSNEQIVPVRERKHFKSNVNKTGYIIFSSDLESFSGHIQLPLPNKRATASRIGYGGNAIVFVVFHAGKEFAVKKTVYRSKEISVHSQLCHPNIINLEAVLVGEKHERHRDKYYVYCFMQKMDINFRNVLSTKDHGCLKHLKMKLVEKRDQWETVLLNVKHVLKSVLKALDYMHGQGLVHRDVKASNILIKTTCQCSEVLFCSCQYKFIVQLGDFDSSATVPGYQLHLEEHQMIRYASVLPLGTMGYRAPEVSMHLVLSGPYEVLYTTGVDIWSFGCLLLAIFIGKSGPLKQRGEASLLLSAQDHPYSQELYHKVIKISELRKYYANVPGACNLAEKCLQVQPHCRPTAKELLQLDFFR
ncbi:uncharacterized protein [Dysidea avara]|uniref:uncharacterized protein isoform X2 n=1 Tax=Dysidea avara TaxID=196820 RepID=UPI00332433ED